MPKVFFALLTCLLLLGSCTQPDAALQPPNTLSLTVEQGLSTEMARGVDLFAAKVEELSEGRLVLEITQAKDVLEALDQGCDMILATNAEVARADANYLSYSSPFFFQNYSHLTMTLNSDRFFNLVSDESISLCGAFPIAAFYDGSEVILSSGALSFDTVDQFDGAELTVSNDAILADLLRSLGTRVKIRDEEYQRLEGFCSRSDPAIECRISSLLALGEMDPPQPFIVSQTFHRARINWLMLSEASKEELSAFEMAVLKEAAAFAIAENDRLVLELEATSLQTAQERGGTLSSAVFGEYFDAVEQALRSNNRFGSVWNWEQHTEVQHLAIGK